MEQRSADLREILVSGNAKGSGKDSRKGDGQDTSKGHGSHDGSHKGGWDDTSQRHWDSKGHAKTTMGSPLNIDSLQRR